MVAISDEHMTEKRKRAEGKAVSQLIITACSHLFVQKKSTAFNRHVNKINYLVYSVKAILLCLRKTSPLPF